MEYAIPTMIRVYINHDFESCDLFYHNVCIYLTFTLYLSTGAWVGGGGEGEGSGPRELHDMYVILDVHVCTYYTCIHVSYSVGEWTSLALLPQAGKYLYISCTCILTGSLKTLHNYCITCSLLS